MGVTTANPRATAKAYQANLPPYPVTVLRSPPPGTPPVEPRPLGASSSSWWAYAPDVVVTARLPVAAESLLEDRVPFLGKPSIRVLLGPLVGVVRFYGTPGNGRRHARDRQRHRCRPVVRGHRLQAAVRIQHPVDEYLCGIRMAGIGQSGNRVVDPGVVGVRYDLVDRRALLLQRVDGPRDHPEHVVELARSQTLREGCRGRENGGVELRQFLEGVGAVRVQPGLVLEVDRRRPRVQHADLGSRGGRVNEILNRLDGLPGTGV